MAGENNKDMAAVPPPPAPAPFLDFARLAAGGAASSGAILEPRKIFTTLARNPRFRRPSDEQGEVLDQWFAERKRQDITLKLNTGAGKTLIGLLALQSSLNEGIAPAVYITPDNYLVSQVLAEAADLGIAATDDADNPAFLAGKAILVVNVYKLINGKSVFGVGQDGAKIPIGALVVDDAHACLATVADQFNLEVGAGHPVYDGLLDLFAQDLEEQSSVGFLDVKSQDPQTVMAVPFWAWQSKHQKVLGLLHAHREDDGIKFVWPLLREVIGLCQCAFGGGRLEIAPRCLPIDQIPSFVRAKRRIYMTATLADDGILITHFHADAQSVVKPIKPKGAGDIGDRMILAPQEINPDISVEDVKALAAEIARTFNVAVIVPSAKRAEYWRDVAAQVLDRNNIAEGVALLKRGHHVGLTVLINKYDGVDLPGNACRLLVIDGLPEVYGLIERVEMTALEGTDLQLLRQVQRLEQGMGRGVRSGEDYCAVLLLGARLTQRIHLAEARSKFTPATLAQMDLGREVTSQVRGRPISDLLPILNYCLYQNPDWWRAGRERLANAPEGQPAFVDPSVKDLREAFDMARNRRPDLACAAVQRAVNNAPERAVKGYLKQQLAEYTSFVDPVQAQEILLSAVQDNPRVLKPLTGITYNKLAAPAEGQAAASVAFMKRRFIEPNGLVLFVRALVDDLSWGLEGTKRFEAAIRDLGHLLGFGSQRPEVEIGKGPDNLWAIGGLRFIVIECKSGATSNSIAKGDCNQLIGSMSWFSKAYDQTCTATPLLIHPVNRFDRYSSPTPDTRVMEKTNLANLCAQLKAFATAVAAGNALTDEARVKGLLEHFNLTGSKFLAAYSSDFTAER